MRRKTTTGTTTGVVCPAPVSRDRIAAPFGARFVCVRARTGLGSVTDRYGVRMGGRDSEGEEPSNDSRIARLLMVAVLTLAVAATGVLVLTSDAAWLRLGVLAALWAALLGVFLASRFRKSLAERENQVSDLQSVYELELEREVAARREYELEVEASARKRVEEENRHDLAELRAELRTLRESLERLTGGEVLVERFALQARSTRMRALGDAAPRVVAAGEDSGRMRRAIMAGQADPASTELMRRPDPAATRQGAPAQPVRREPQRRPAYRPQPQRDPDEPRKDVPAAAAPPTMVARPVQPAQQPLRPARPGETQEPQRAWPGQAPRQAAVTQRRAQPVRREAPPPQQQPDGGRRRAAEYEPTQRAEPVSRHGVDQQRVDQQRVEEQPGGRRRADEQPRRAYDEPPTKAETVWENEDPETTGAHAAGKSVTELLAAHGKEEAPRRHRRRAD